MINMSDSIRHVVKTTQQWNDRCHMYDLIERGCLCIELCPNGTTRIKVGEGNKYYAQLPYIGGCGNGYNDLSDYFTKEEVMAIMRNLNCVKIVSTNVYPSPFQLPKAGNELGDIRYVANPSPSVSTDPVIYLWNGYKWIYIGGIDVDMSKYVTREEIMPRVEALESIDDFTGADDGHDGTSGYVPAPQAGDQDKFLRGDGTWSTLPGDVTLIGGDGISVTEAPGGGYYINLTPATTSTLGGIIIGDGLSTDDEGLTDVALDDMIIFGNNNPN